jgi:hypothetical protein
MRIALAADELTGIASALPDELRRRGHETLVHGAYADGERADWAWCSEAAARDVAEGRASQAALVEILDAWFAQRPSRDAADVENVGHLDEIERARSAS